MTNEKYFAYGSNLNLSDWERWCRLKGLPWDTLKPIEIGYLPDMELTFDYLSRSRGGGVLNIKEKIGQLVPGVIFDVEEPGWKSLDLKEGAPNCYERFRCTALTQSGDEVPVTTYRVCEEKRTDDFIKPTDEYVRIVREGYDEYELDDEMLNATSHGTTPPPSLDSLFVYGTLMRGECRFPAVERFSMECILLAEAPGRLLECGKDYPGMIRPDGPNQWVQGEYLRFGNIGQVLQIIDEIERFKGFGEPESLFHRGITEVGMRDGHVRRAWTYYLVQREEGKAIISSGDWRHHLGKDKSFLDHLTAMYRGKYRNRLAEIEAEIGVPIEVALQNGLLSERRIAIVTQEWLTAPPG